MTPRLVYTIYYCTAAAWIGLGASLILLSISREIRHPTPYEDEETKYIEWISSFVGYFLLTVLSFGILAFVKLGLHPKPLPRRLVPAQTGEEAAKSSDNANYTIPAANDNPPFFKTILTTYTIKMITHTLQEEEEEEEELQKESLLPITASTPLLTQQPHPPTQHEENNTHPTTSPTLFRRLNRPLFYFMILVSIGIFINLVVRIIPWAASEIHNETFSEDKETIYLIWVVSSMSCCGVTGCSAIWLEDMRQRMDETQTEKPQPQPLQSQSPSPIPFQLDEEAAMYTFPAASYHPRFVPSSSHQGLRGEFDGEYKRMTGPPRPASCAF
ncbi:hypothetical protein FQN55_000579 [Onygenales sp. PD_40]|nr:hypothetical protein FQN55_000579 [Onygenales sp. PD_40]KAK2789397.1 hypothetical protein FQN52_006261 [Onygenales sp. PD_12]